MRIVLHCSFAEHTANGILMAGRLRALRRLGHSVALHTQPFRGVSTWRLLCGCWEPLRAMIAAEAVVIHKALPLGLVYMLALRLLAPRVKRVLIVDDWEGVGGFASVRSARSVRRKMLVTLCEEWMPRLAHGVWCVSRVLEQRVRASCDTPVLYLPNGGEAFDVKPDREVVRVGYVGTLKSRWLVDFLAEVGWRLGIGQRFVIVGGGPLLPELRSALPDAIYTGQVPHAAAREWLGRISIALLPLSTEYPDTLIDASRSSTKIFEYMCAGCAVVASPCGEASDRRGVINVFGGPYSWAKEITELMWQHECREWGDIACKEFAEHYTHDVLCRKAVEWMEGL